MKTPIYADIVGEVVTEAGARDAGWDSTAVVYRIGEARRASARRVVLHGSYLQCRVALAELKVALRDGRGASRERALGRLGLGA